MINNNAWPALCQDCGNKEPAAETDLFSSIFEGESVLCYVCGREGVLTFKEGNLSTEWKPLP